MFKSPAALLEAKSIAIVGASERANWPAALRKNLEDFGFKGPVYPINPRRETVWDEKCYPDFSALPEPVDLALVVIPGEAVIEVLENGVANGLKSALVFAANIGEGTDPETVARGRALSDLCERSGLRACGPNCLGIVSPRSGVFANPSRALCRIPAGNIGAVFQSGGAMQHWAAAANARGLRFSHMITSGNEIDLTLADYVNYMVDDPDTDTIVLFIEAIRRPEDFMLAAARALEAGKPIIALKTGRSAKSQSSALSHTGAICGDFDAYVAMCERLGIVNCPTYEDMIETTLAFQPKRYPKGRRLGLLTISGGVVDLLHDYIAELGADVPEFSPATQSALEDLINPGLKVNNPLDGGGGVGFGPKHAAPICEIAAEDANIDIVAWTMRLPGERTNFRDPDPLKAMLAKTEKPVIAFERMTYAPTEDDLAFQEETGIPFLQGLAASLGALNRLGFYGERVNRPALPPVGPAPDVKALDDAAILKALAAAGAPAPAGAAAATAEEAADLAEKIGFPVALKIDSAEILHKTEIGGVRLHLAGREEIARAFTEMTDGARRAVPDATVNGVTIQEMVSGVEILVGCRTDPFYGPMIGVGAGGVLVELFKDVAFRLLPVTPAIIDDMLEELQSAALLDGYRGAPPSDRAALVRAICGIGEFYLQHRGWLAEIEVNPLTVLAVGGGVRAVDVRPIRSC
jgi:acetyltransferase